MAKDNLFLGFARGSVGDVTFSRVHGQQVARARNRAPRNPQSTWQLLQRVIMKTASGAYSFFQDLTNHSFQGFAEGMPCQSRFLQLAVDQMRYVFRLEINAHDEESILESQEANYLSAGEIGCAIKEWQISEGSLRPVEVELTGNIGYPKLPAFTEAVGTPVTYARMCEVLGLERGDQLTFCVATVDDTGDSPLFNGFAYARLILEPSDGNMDGAIHDDDGVIQHPNARNEGSLLIYGATDEPQPLSFSVGYGMNRGSFQNSIMAACVIASREVGGMYQRSDSKLVLAPDARMSHDHYTDYMGDAIYSFRTMGGSALYLNQAE